MEQPQRVAVVGGGAIGSGWAAHFLRMGLDVVAYDPAPGAEAAMRGLVERAWPILEELGLRPGASPERLRFAASVGEAVADAEHVQESAPERLDAKVRLFAEMDAATPPSTVLASSTSGFLMTDIQRECAHPERTVIAHPFQPPYLVPLVEVVAGARTSPETVERAAAFFAAQGKEVVRPEREAPAFVANRLQEAVWREMLAMIAAGDATFEEIDRAIVHGPGLRWALMGPGLTYTLAGGAGGMRHRLDHFRPEVTAAWCRQETPPITDELREALIEGAERAAAGRSIDEMEAERDRALLALLRSRRPL